MPDSPLFLGCAAALVTPFLPDGSLDEAALKRLILRQIAAHADAIVLLGTTGEPSTLDMEERERIIRIGIETINGRMPVIIGTGTNDTKKSIAYARQAKDAGADAQLTVTPYYNKAARSGLIRHFNAIMDACDLPMIVYNVPSRTGMNMLPETIAELAVHPQLIGAKEASGNPLATAEILELTNRSLPVYCGNDEIIVPLMAIGASGAISVAANAAPMEIRAMTAACLDGRFRDASAMQQALAPLIRLLSAQVNPIPIKAALAMMELINDELRLPLTPLEEPYRTNLRHVLTQCQLL